MTTYENKLKNFKNLNDQEIQFIEVIGENKMNKEKNAIINAMQEESKGKFIHRKFKQPEYEEDPYHE